MDDRGSKITALARDIVRANMVLGPESSAPRIALSFKALGFATILAALGGGAVVKWNAESNRAINRYEKTELQALVFYAARQYLQDKAQ